MYEELRSEIINLAEKGTRLDGRAPDEYRDLVIEKGVSKNAEGSAKVKIGETEVIAGVKLELMKPYPDSPDVGSMMVNVELTPMSSPDFESGPPSILAIELARITDRAIRESKAIDVHKLCITPGEQAWMVIIDVCTLNDAGNLFDAISIASLAALQDAVFPARDGEAIDYKNKTDEKLPLSLAPLNITVFKYGDHLIVDPTSEEMKIYDVRLSVGVLENGKLCSLQKGGDEALTEDEFFKMIELAQKKAEEVRKSM